MIHFIVAIYNPLQKVEKEKPDYMIVAMHILFTAREWFLQF